MLESGTKDVENGLCAACSLFCEPDVVRRDGCVLALSFGSAGELRAVPVSVGVKDGVALSPQEKCVLVVSSIKEW